MARGSRISRLVPLTDRLQSQLASSAPTPEDELLAREADAAPVPIGHGASTRRRQLARAKAAMERIPSGEARCVALSMMGVPQEAIAAELGIALATVQYRIARGVARMRWLVGPGGAFTRAEAERDLGRHLLRADVAVLAELWETTSPSEVARRLGMVRQRVWDAFLRLVGELAELARSEPALRRYARGFAALRERGIHALWLRPPTGSGAAGGPLPSQRRPKRAPAPRGPGLAKCTSAPPRAAGRSPDSQAAGW